MKIVFLAQPNKDYPYPMVYSQESMLEVEQGNCDVVTTDLSALSFDLLTCGRFKEIFLYANNQMFELKLGKNDWTDKELRESHNLLKLVKSYILN